LYDGSLYETEFVVSYMHLNKQLDDMLGKLNCSPRMKDILYEEKPYFKRTKVTVPELTFELNRHT